MKALVIIVILIIIGGGGYYFYHKHQEASQMPPSDTTMMKEDNSMKAAPTTSSSSNGAMMQEGTHSGVKEFTVEGKNFSMTPNTLTVNKGDKVKITFKNTGGMHDFVLDEFNVKTNPIQSGQEATIAFTADKTGSFQYYCSVGNHRAMGMFGTLKVK